MNIAFFCIPAHGHTNPTLAVVRELTARGHTVRYYTTEAFRAKVEAASAVFVPFDAEAARPGMTAADDARLGSDLAFSTKLIVDLTLAADDWLSRELTAHRPDVIVGDSMAFWAKLASKKHGIPFVSSTTTFAFNRFSAKVIGQNGAGFLQFLLAQPRINRQLKRLRAAGYAVKSMFDIIANDNETETVVYTSPEFQPCADTFSEKYHFVGPLLRPAQSSFEKLPGRSLIYISLGTVNNDALPFYRACLAAFGGDPRFQLRALRRHAGRPRGVRPHSEKLHRPRERGPDGGARLRRRLSHPLRHEQRERRIVARSAARPLPADAGAARRGEPRRCARRGRSAHGPLRRRHPPRGRDRAHRSLLPRKRAEARRQLPPLRRRGRGSRCHRARGELSDSMQKHAPADSGSVFLCYVNSYSFFSR